jgi:plastocyanin
MNKKVMWLGVVLVVIIVVVLVVSSRSGSDSSMDKVQKNNGQNAEMAESLEGEMPDLTPNETLSEEGVITADGEDFSPRSLSAAAGTQVFLTFAAEDGLKHYFAFKDQALSYLFLNFSKEEGSKSINFPAPEPGIYTFYVDTEDNTGTLTIK